MLYVNTGVQKKKNPSDLLTCWGGIFKHDNAVTKIVNLIMLHEDKLSEQKIQDKFLI